MAEFLDEMARASAARARQSLAGESLAVLRRRALDVPPAPALRLGHGFDLIAEFKLRSPALGRLGGGGDDVCARVEAYAAAGTAAVSVLTEPTRFAGRLEHLAAAAAALQPLSVPVMRKDFLVDPYQLCEARAAGAGGALLILRLLSPALVAEMLDCARELGLFVLVEAFDAADLECLPAWTGGSRPRERSAGSEESENSPADRSHVRSRPVHAGEPCVLLGVNCRDLNTLEVRPERFAELAPRLPRGWPWVAESGLASPADCAAVARQGYRLALVGGALMAAADPGATVRAMLGAGRAAA
ncbi:MAG: indole-3-glycerol-phosphate synthase TrpC [Gammaproteobacteria bacterium]|nr:indole-3-glycerol-phosphate synthase TrpC [Gammaproteobacteria bacterium]